MAAKKWVWIVGGVVGGLLLLGLALLGAGIYFIARHVQSETSTPAAAQNELDQIRARFGGREPLIELDTDNPGRMPVVHRERSQGSGTVESLEIVVWDPDESRLVRVSLPFWLVRLSPGRLKFSGSELPIQFDETNLTPEDLERYGPGLILDHRESRGTRVLLFTR
jgi:hypothetical protein